MEYEIRYGLAGGFGEWQDTDYEDKEEVEEEAYNQACSVYDTYDGLYFKTLDDIKEENPDWSDDECNEEWEEKRDGWLCWEVRERQ